MAINYADSGKGWYCDNRYFKNHIGLLATINGQDYKKRIEGACVCVTAYNSITSSTGVIVISSDIEYATYQTSRGSSIAHSSFIYKGITWYISAFSYWQIGQYSETSGKTMYVTITSNNYAEVGQYILEQASLRSESEFSGFFKKIKYNGKPKVIRRLCQIINGLEDRFMRIEVYDTNRDGVVDNSEKVNNHTVESDVPLNAVFTDTIYDDTEIRSDIRQLNNSMLLLMETFFNSEVSYLVDHEGNYLVDHEGNRILAGYYDSKFLDVLDRIKALENKKYIVWDDGTEEDS